MVNPPSRKPPGWSDVRVSRGYDPATTADYRHAVTGMTIGSLVKALREEAGLSQKELANASGMSQPAVARLERGGVVPSVETLERIGRSVGRRLVVGFAADQQINLDTGTDTTAAIVTVNPSDVDADLQFVDLSWDPQKGRPGAEPVKAAVTAT